MNSIIIIIGFTLYETTFWKSQNNIVLAKQVNKKDWPPRLASQRSIDSQFLKQAAINSIGPSSQLANYVLFGLADVSNI